MPLEYFKYLQGNALRIRMYVRKDGALFDPTVVRWRVLQPDNEEKLYITGTDAEAKRIETGVYDLIFTPMQIGTYYADGEAIGNITQAISVEFEVIARRTAASITP
jgi:hypothetical protein